MTNKKEIATLIKSFVDGTTNNKWAWDDFVSIRQRDPEIESIRQRILKIDKDYPPTKPNEYCNDEGARALLAIAESLEK